ncbi:HECT domain-containing protein [Forsythia ovata]|uniref:HECT domain-containing protein n=1 Tax=Forsythia ovata TaxID=205694 RepID=A0ABD1NUS0_9LAMI
MRNSYATVPHGRTSYPCLKVQFVKANGEISLRDYTEDVVSLIPFCLSMKLKDIYGLKRRSLTFVWKTIDAANVTDVHKPVPRIFLYLLLPIALTYSACFRVMLFFYSLEILSYIN